MVTVFLKCHLLILISILLEKLNKNTINNQDLPSTKSKVLWKSINVIEKKFSFRY